MVVLPQTTSWTIHLSSTSLSFLASIDTNNTSKNVKVLPLTKYVFSSSLYEKQEVVVDVSIMPLRENSREVNNFYSM